LKIIIIFIILHLTFYFNTINLFKLNDVLHKFHFRLVVLLLLLLVLLFVHHHRSLFSHQSSLLRLQLPTLAPSRTLLAFQIRLEMVVEVELQRNFFEIICLIVLVAHCALDLVVLPQKLALVVVGKEFSVSSISNWLDALLAALLLIKLVHLSQRHWLLDMKVWELLDVRNRNHVTG
jgi:hypothetical protein